MTLKDKREDETNELIDGMSLRQFILNENSFAKTMLTSTLPGNLKKATFLTIFVGIVKEFIEKYKSLLFPLATAITFYETRQAWNNYKKKHNQNFAAKWDLFMTGLMAVKETTAVIIALAFTMVSAIVAPIMFLIMIGRSALNSLWAFGKNLCNLASMRYHGKTFSAEYAAEKAALINNLDNFFVTGILWVGILTSFLAPHFAAAFGGLLAVSYAISMTTVGVLAASTARSIYNTVTGFFGSKKPKNTDDHKNEYLSSKNFISLKDSHIDDLLLKLEYSFKKNPDNESSVKELLEQWIKQETDITSVDDNAQETAQYNAKIDFLNKLTLILNKKSDKPMVEIINDYRNQPNSPLKLIMTSEHGNISGTQKLAVLFDKLVELREKRIEEHNVSDHHIRWTTEDENIKQDTQLNPVRSKTNVFLGILPQVPEILPKTQPLNWFKNHDLWHTMTYKKSLSITEPEQKHKKTSIGSQKPQPLKRRTRAISA